MRGFIGAAVLLSVAGAMAGPCGLPDPHAPPHADDLSWVQSHAIVYGAGEDTGVFRIALGTAKGAETIPVPDGVRIEDSELSPDDRFLEYDGVDRAAHRRAFVYDAQSGLTVEIPFAAQARDEMRFTPGSDYVFSRTVDRGSIHLFDTAKHTSRSVPLAGLSPEAHGELSEAWPRETRHKFYRAGPDKRLFALDPRTGTSGPVETIEKTDGTHYLQDGQQIGLDRTIFASKRDPDEMPLAGDAVAVIKGLRLFIRRPGKADETLGDIAPADTSKIKGPYCEYHALAVMGDIDGRYLVYNLDDRIWIYGVEEDRKAILADSNYAMLRW